MPVSFVKESSTARVEAWKDGKQRLVPVTDPAERESIKREHNDLKARRTGVIAESSPQRMPVSELVKRGRLNSTLPTNVQVLTPGEEPTKPAQTCTMPRHGEVKMNAWTQTPQSAGSWVATRVPDLPLVSGGMDLCTTVQLLGNSPKGEEESTHPKIASGHIAPANDKAAVKAEIERRIDDMRAEGLAVDMSLGGGVHWVDDSGDVAKIARAVAKDRKVPIVGDKAGEHRDNFEDDFVQGAVIESHVHPKTGAETYHARSFNALRTDE